MILTLRTDKPEAEIGLYENGNQLEYHTWQAHRALAETLHKKIRDIAKTSGNGKSLSGIIIYKGPGSFTGLRIGMSVSNALAYSQNLPIVATSGETWLEDGLENIKKAQSGNFVVPEYGSGAHITIPKK